MSNTPEPQPGESRNLGEQPLTALLATRNLDHHDVVSAAPPGALTHKMVSRAARGRWLTMRSRLKVLNAVNRACKSDFRLSDLFSY